MSQDIVDSLLKPSLKKEGQQKPMFSITAHFLVAFFGGPIALIIFSMISLSRIGKLIENRLSCIALILIVMAGIGFITYSHFSGLPEWLRILGSDERSIRLLMRIFSILLCGVIYVLYKSYFELSELVGAAANPWVPGIASVIAGSLIYMAILYTVRIIVNG